MGAMSLRCRDNSRRRCEDYRQRPLAFELRHWRYAAWEV
jgi:hypothetical protein